MQGDKNLWKKIWKGDIIMSHGTTHSKGVAILIPDNIEATINSTEIDPNRRYIVLCGKFGGKELNLINYYAPTKNDAKKQLEYLEIIIPKINDLHENLILAGDLNTYLDPKLDKKGGKDETTSIYATRILHILEEYNLIDIWRTLFALKITCTN